MKTILLAAAALLATPAMAQNHTGSAPADTPPAATAESPQQADHLGGYQPGAPALKGTPATGSTVRFEQAPDPNTAYPPPPAQEKYPVCKKGQFDKCEQAGSGDGNVHKAAPKHGAKHHAKKHHWKKKAVAPAAAPPPAK